MNTRAIPALVIAAVILLVQGCSHPPRLAAVPNEQTRAATIPGIPDARFFVNDTVEGIRAAGMAALARERAFLAASGHRGPLPPANFLAISGGGDDGAFGAGLLVGWTAAGTRPEFKLVTGISTGALTAPFAFLGPDYDDELTEVYTAISPEDVFLQRNIFSVLFNDALTDSTPLHRLVAHYADEEMFRRIGEEYRRGRLLLIGTTNLDAGQAVIWNIGALAVSGHPDALDIFHRILVASAAIPGVFPPMMFDVEVDGQPFQEMHVDGGAMAQVFVYPPGLDLRSMAQANDSAARQRRLFIIRNARLDPNWASIERRALDIAGRAISSLIQTQGIGDLYQIFAIAHRDGVEFNLAYISREFTVEHRENFDPVYMQALFDYGYELGRNGYRWHQAPPGWLPDDVPPGVVLAPRSTAAAVTPRSRADTTGPAAPPGDGIR